jgi:septum formation topological specificity factor MinE
MEISHYMFAGVGVAMSILAFFIKRNKWEIDDMKERLRQIEISDAGQSKDVEHLTKLSEDRRRDIQKLFEKMETK